RYFDVFVQYAKAAPEDLLVRITVANRGPDAAILHVLPTLWFRNTWSWQKDAVKPVLIDSTSPGLKAVRASHPDLGELTLCCDGDPTLLFTENETNNERLFRSGNAVAYVKDGINDYLVEARKNAVNPGGSGTKAAAHYRAMVAAGQTAVYRLRLTKGFVSEAAGPFGRTFDSVFDDRLRDADEFYASITPDSAGTDKARVMRQALAGMLWSKQYFLFDADKWLL